MGVTTFEDDDLGSVADELDNLGHEFALDMFLHCQNVHGKVVDLRRLKVFATYRGVEMFRAGYDDKFVVFAVEYDGESDLRITIMFAGRHGAAAVVGGYHWNGTDYSALDAMVVQPRAAAIFD